MPGELRLAGIGDEAAPDLAGQLRAMHSLGWTGIELRTVNGTAIAGLDERAFRALVAAVSAARLEVVCVDSQIGSWARPVTASFDDDLAELDVLAQRCRALGTRRVRIMSYPGGGLSEIDWRHRAVGRIRVLAERAADAGLVLLHENCTGWAGRSAQRTLRLLAEVDSPALRLLFDTGNGIAHGYQAPELLADIAAHVDHVHVKDGVSSPGGPVWTLPGEGHARVGECLRLLHEHDYGGWLSFEPHFEIQPHLGRGHTGPGSVERFIEAGRHWERTLATAQAR